jgi:hypothetical protein
MTNAYKLNLSLFILFIIGFVFVEVTGINKVLFTAINTYAGYTSPYIWANLSFLGDTMAATAILILFIRKRPDRYGPE